jgi:wobble nucleotide-excising tRNase
MATRLKLNRAKFLDACRASLVVTKDNVTQVQAEIKKYDWRAEAKSRVEALDKALKDPKATESSFSDDLYAAGREFKKNDLEYELKNAKRRVEEIEDMIALAEIEVGEEITVSTSDHFITSLLRQARQAEKS